MSLLSPKNINCIFSDNDYFVPLDQKNRFEELLDAKTIVVNGKGHISQDDDVYELKESQKQPNKKKSKNNVTQLKTRFHNINQSFEKYTAEELERMLLENQKNKFNNDKVTTISHIESKETNSVECREEFNSNFTPHYRDHFENINC